MRDYDELILDLRRHHCDAKEDDTQEVCEECAYDVIVADKSKFNGITDVCTCGLMHRAADAIEELLDELTTIRKQLPRWISVEDALPKKKVGDEGYIGYLVLSDGEYQIADFTHDKYMQTAYEFHVDGEYDPNVTHWMELPPKGVE